MDSETIVSLTGSDLAYSYRELPERCSGVEIDRYIQRTRDLFDPVARGFDDARNTEWFIRSYLALKFVLGATVLANSAEYAEDRNLQVALPYLGYYTILNCCRSFLFTLPCLDWRGEKTIEMTHSNILNVTADKLKRLGQRHEDTLKPRLWAAKEQRDLFSYRFPATGLAVFGDGLVCIGEAIGIARLLTELAQINLSCLESCVAKHNPNKKFKLLELDDMWHTMQYDMKTQSFVDDEDYSRVGYFVRKYKGPATLADLATDGLVDDFFGAWAPTDDRDDANRYDADRQWDLLLDIW
ncbi:MULTISPECIES: hypothetical protein [unclassified Mesorhizobium]|uniref:hypothetical protein n=1 Tax=unclassified Mesorhizobium TaxID=325217 RepID=UPI001FE08D31|nr:MULTISPECIES: hypothetical protein [unclassified Mesorhizobium]